MLIKFIKKFPFLSYGIFFIILGLMSNMLWKVFSLQYDDRGIGTILIIIVNIVGVIFLTIDDFISNLLKNDILSLMGIFFVLFLFDIILIMIKKMIKNLKINKKYLNRLH
jgi:hypothetical protein